MANIARLPPMGPIQPLVGYDGGPAMAHQALRLLPSKVNCMEAASELVYKRALGAVDGDSVL